MKARYLPAVIAGGLVAGILDIAFALSMAAYNGMAPVRLLQVVASGAFGKAAFTGGAAMAAGGLALHFALSLVWASVFVALATAWPALQRKPHVWGPLFGVLVFLAMRLVVLPLSAFPYPVSFKPLPSILDLLSHMFLFGLPIALAGKRFIEATPAGVPDNTAVRTALWRALHVLADPPPHVFEDVVGLKIAAPGEGWRDRPDMSPFTRPFRASILARARFVEDLVEEQVARGVSQYVILGAGLDTFAQRRADLGARMRVFEIDQPGPQAWKRQRLGELGLGVPPFLRLVPVDFEAGDSWWKRLAASGFDRARPAVVASTGVSMYLTREAIEATLRQFASLAPGSTIVMSFMLPIDMVDPEVRIGVERAAEGARASGTPFISFFTPEEMLALARECGFKEPRHVSAAQLAERYFAGRTDGLRPPKNSEELLVAAT
jgi:methyltransferase (TIGR00027 family)